MIDVILVILVNGLYAVTDCIWTRKYLSMLSRGNFFYIYFVRLFRKFIFLYKKNLDIVTLYLQVGAPLASRGIVFKKEKNSLKPTQDINLNIKILRGHM